MLRFDLKSIIILIFVVSGYGADFLDEQKQYSRVRKAVHEKENIINHRLSEAGFKLDSIHTFIRIFKSERKLELWLKSTKSATYQLHHTYQFCSSSGDLGPKRRQGDFQIPEGFYYIDRFNPYSSFYLSLGLNYPNKSDRILSHPKYPGGDIFIHGDCVTIGCVPITDDKIKELYLYAIYAKRNGQRKIPVHIYPYTFSNMELADSIERDSSYSTQQAFWADLKKIFLKFENMHKLPIIHIDKNTGRYKISGGN